VLCERPSALQRQQQGSAVAAAVVRSRSFFGWSRIPNDTGSRSRIFLSDSDCPVGSFFTPHSYIENSCWNCTISFETFVEIEIPRFPMILTAKFHSLHVKESESQISESRSRESGILERSESQLELDILPPTSQPRTTTWKWQAKCLGCPSRKLLRTPMVGIPAGLCTAEHVIVFPHFWYELAKKKLEKLRFFIKMYNVLNLNIQKKLYLRKWISLFSVFGKAKQCISS